MEYLRAFDAYQGSFDIEPVRQFLEDRTEIPFACGSLYLAMVVLGPRFMANRKPVNVRFAFTIWNLILSIFSIIGSYYTIGVVAKYIQSHGLHYTVCEPLSSWCSSGRPGFWGAVFTFSKIAEFFDTAFLIASKKPVIFLQWYHHITVMLFCWFGTAELASPAMWYTCMNFFVHSVMYAYFGMMSAGSVTRKMVKPFAPFITAIQILQMVAGTVIAVYTGYQLEMGNGCGLKVVTSRAALLMYGSYLVLFAMLFKKLYFSSGSKAPKGAAKKQQ